MILSLIASQPFTVVQMRMVPRTCRLRVIFITSYLSYSDDLRTMRRAGRWTCSDILRSLWALWCCSPVFVLAQSSSLVWSGAFNGSGVDAAIAVATDAVGNIYTTGYFANTADLDPSAGVSSHTAFGGFDVFVAKTDQSGTLLWSKQFGGTSQDLSRSIAVDGNGDVYVTGLFRGVVDLDPGAGSATSTSAGADDAFIVKLSPAGDLLWAYTFGSVSTDLANDVAVDATGQVYVTGNFTNTVDFDAGAGVTTLTSNGAQVDIYVLKLNGAGNFLWARGAGGIFPDNGYSITLDGIGNAIITGSFQTAVDLDPGPGVSMAPNNGGWDILLWKLDATGTLVWFKTMGGISDEAGDHVAVDTNDDILLTGFFNGVVDMDPNAGTTSLSAVGQSDVFVNKYNAFGELVWARSMGSTTADVGMHLVTDVANEVHCAGYFTGSADFDPGVGVSMRTCAGGQDAFVLHLNSAGELLCAETIGSASSDVGHGVAVGALGTCITVGFFSTTVDFDPGPSVANLVSNAASLDGFVQRIHWCGGSQLPIELLVFDGLAEPLYNKLYWITASEHDNDHFTLEKSLDMAAWSVIGIVDGAGDSQVTQHYDHLDHDISAPVSYYRLRQTDLNGAPTYAPVVVVSRNDIELIDIHPNPSVGEVVVLQVVSRMANVVTLIGTGSLGQQVVERTFRVEAGLNAITVPLAGIASSVIRFRAYTDTGAASSVKQLVLAR